MRTDAIDRGAFKYHTAATVDVFRSAKMINLFSTFDIRITTEPVAQYDKFQNVIWAAFSHEYSNSHFPSTSAREDGSLDFPRL